MTVSGSYVARAFPKNTFALLAESASFTVNDVSVGTDQTSYAPGSTITVNYSGLPGNVDDWIALAPAGSPNTTYRAYVFTNGQTSGAATFTAPAAVGAYVVRAFPKNGFTLLAESATFTVASQAATMTTDQSVYAPGTNVVVTYNGLTGPLPNTLVLATPGAPASSYLTSLTTLSGGSGTASLSAPATAGTYVARAISSDGTQVLLESTPFTVGTNPLVNVAQSSYAAGARIVVNYTGLPGNVDDWIALAPAGSATTTYRAYVFTNGRNSGSVTFTAPAAGSYVVRALLHNTVTLLAESPAFTVSDPVVTLDKSSYAAGSTITVTYAGLPGFEEDWIAIAPVGSPNTTYLAYVFTGGQTSGTATFTAPATPGSYVVRAFPNNTFVPVWESAAFAVNTPTVTVDHPSYNAGGTITVSYAWMPGNADDWIALAPAGSPNTTYVNYIFTGGQTSGTATFPAPAIGSYVARAFPHNTFTLLAESPTFTVSGAVASLDKSSYAAGSTITVTYAGLPGFAEDWIALAPAGSSNTTYLAYVFTGGQTSGTATLTAPATAGSYVVRAFPNNTFVPLWESAPFAVNTATVMVDQASYNPGGTITVSYAWMPGYADDWIALAPAGSPNTTYVNYVFTGGQTSGTATFPAPATAGSYVARAFPHNIFTLLAESTSFDVVAGTAASPCGVLGWGLNTIAAIAPGGATAALATADGHVEVRRWSDNTVLPIDNGGFGAAAVAYSPDGALLAAAASDAVKVWRVADGVLVASIAGLANSSGVGVSNDGSVVAAIHGSQVLVSRAAGIVSIALNSPLAVGVSPDGSIVAVLDMKRFSISSYTFTAAGWRSSDGQQAWSGDVSVDFTGSTAGHVSFTRDGTMVAYGRGAAGAATVGVVLRAADGSRVSSTGTNVSAFSDDGQAVVGTASDGSIRLSRVSDGGTARTFTLPVGSKVLAAGFGTGTTTLAVVQPPSGDALQLVMDGAQVGAVPRVSWQVALNSLALAPDGAHLLAGERELRLWDTSTLSATGGGSGPLRRQVAAFSPDSARLAVCGSSSVSVGNVKPTSAPAFTIPVAAQSVAFGPDGTLIATGHSDGTANLWDANNGALVRQLWNLTVSAREITGIAFSPDGTRVATASGATLKVWRVADGGDLATINAGQNVDTVRFSPDGAWLIGAMGDVGSGAKIWDIASGTVVRTLTGTSNAVSPSAGGVLYMATSAGIERFRLPDFTVLGPLPSTEKGGLVRFIDISADGTMIASIGNSAVVRLWCLH
jgi:WD40 repeat protein